MTTCGGGGDSGQLGLLGFIGLVCEGRERTNTLQFSHQSLLTVHRRQVVLVVGYIWLLSLPIYLVKHETIWPIRAIAVGAPEEPEDEEDGEDGDEDEDED